MRRFLAGDLSGEQVYLEKESSHHLLRVSGIAPGECVELVDGQGGHVEAELLDSDRGRARLRVKRRLPQIPRVENRVLAVALLRSSVFDQVIRQATELGVDRIIPIQADRSVAKEGKPERWARVARAAMIQCGRTFLPLIDPVTCLDALLLTLDTRLSPVMLIPGGSASTTVEGPSLVMIGPEGGWSPRERELARTHGARPFSLGPHTLRADTAVVAALARLASPG